MMIVFFDGVCGLCHSSVKWLIKRDERRILKYAPLEGETAAKYLSQNDLQANSIIAYYQDTTYREFSAVRILLKTLEHPLSPLAHIIPLFLGNFGYRLVAKVRYSIFGRYETCPLPKENERSLFLP